MAASAAPSLVASTVPSAVVESHVAAPSHRGKLCEGDGNAKGRALSKAPLGHAEAAGGVRTESLVPAPKGHWTWVNFWAAWCAPCREEMPRLLTWQAKLTRAGAAIRFTFVSLDDDERQLQQLLDHEPANGLKSSLWLPDGASRTSWLTGLKMKSAPELPEQMLIDPSGHVRCFIEGAVEESDYDEIEALVTHP